MGLWQRLTGRAADNPAQALYQAIVARGREPGWYQAGAVPDTVNGRFDTIASVLAIVLLRLEAEPTAAPASARLIECFIDDMDAQLRQIGIGDVVVGKRMGRMMGMVGGRLGAFRDALAPGADDGLEDALLRNLYRGEHPGDAALAYSAGELRRLHGAMAGIELDALMAGQLPA